MTKAWQKREFEQRDLLEKLMKNATLASCDYEHDSFFLALSAVLIDKLMADPLLGVDNETMEGYCENLKITAEDFSRSPEEAQEILAQLLIKLAKAGLSKIHHAYTRQTIAGQEILYDGHQAMDEVPYIEP